jgi:hypothetical protein
MEIANALVYNLMSPVTLTATGNQTAVQPVGVALSALAIFRTGTVSGGSPTGSLAYTDSADNSTFAAPASGALTANLGTIASNTTTITVVPAIGLRKYFRLEYTQGGAGNVPADCLLVYLPKIY